MAVAVETLEKLERKITLSLPVETIQSEVQARLRKLSRQVKMDGFRPGRVPLSIVAQRYGYGVHYEVVNDKVGKAFFSAANEAKLRVAGQPTINESQTAADGQIHFDAVFEVYPEVQVDDLAGVVIEKASAEITPEAIERTVQILRKQRRSFAQRSAEDVAQEGDRVTVDFVGNIDGEPFNGGKADDFAFIIGEGQMLQEFDQAVRGMKPGESKTFPLAFPSDYHGADVAGKTADFFVTLKKLEAPHLPQVNEAFAKSMGIEDGSVEGLHADIKKNLEREVKFRLNAKNKAFVMDALMARAQLDLPRSLVQLEMDRLAERARDQFKANGIKDVDKIPLPEEALRAQAQRRVRLGLILAELVRQHGLAATPAQIQAHIQELAASYEKPQEVVRWYQGNAQRMAEAEAIVTEKNVVDFVLSKAQVSEKPIAFDELMAQS